MKKLIISGVCAAVFGTTFFANDSFAETPGNNTNPSIKAASAQSSSFIDVPQSHWAFKEIQYMADHKIMQGYGNGYFGAKDKVTREQLAATIYRTIKIWKDPLNQTHPFNDIGNSMFQNEIKELYDNGVFAYVADGKFYPSRTLTRAEVAASFKNAFWLNKKFDHQFNDMQGHWANEAVQILYSNGITNGVGDNNFDPNGSVTREQLAVFLYRAIPVSSRPIQDKLK